MLLHIDAHEKRAEIADSVIVLNFVDRDVLNLKIRHQKHRGIEAGFHPDIEFTVIGTLDDILHVSLCKGRPHAGNTAYPYRHRPAEIQSQASLQMHAAFTVFFFSDWHIGIGYSVN